MKFSFARGFFERRYPAHICYVNSIKRIIHREKFIQASVLWGAMPDSQKEKWEKWAKGQDNKKYKCGYGAFIGLNMIAASCGIPTRQSPPPESQSIAKKPDAPLLTYAGGVITLLYNYPQLQEMESAKLRLWFRSNNQLRRQIAAVLDLKATNPGTISVNSVSSGGGERIQLAEFECATIKARIDIVAAAQPDTAPLVSEPSDEVSVRIVDY